MARVGRKDCKKYVIKLNQQCLTWPTLHLSNNTHRPIRRVYVPIKLARLATTEVSGNALTTVGVTR
jgi:hypothetical protein